MEEVRCDVCGQQIELDSGCVDIVRYFNENGLPTIMCCSGHPEENDPFISMFWVEFDQSVTDEDVLKFQINHTPNHQPGAFISCGRFALRLYCMDIERKNNEEVQCSVESGWCYFAANQEAADRDLQLWMTGE